MSATKIQKLIADALAKLDTARSLAETCKDFVVPATLAEQLKTVHQTVNDCARLAEGEWRSSELSVGDIVTLKNAIAESLHELIEVTDALEIVKITTDSKRALIKDTKGAQTIVLLAHCSRV